MDSSQSSRRPSQGARRDDASSPDARQPAGATGTDERVVRRRLGPGRRIRFGALLGPLLLLGRVGLSAAGVVDERTLAAPSPVVQAGDLVATAGSRRTSSSLHRAVVGLAIGVTTGTVLAVIAGLSRLGEAVVDSPVQISGRSRAWPDPPGDHLVRDRRTAEDITIALGVHVPVYIDTYAGIRGVDAKLIETAKTFGVGRWRLVRDVVIPGAVPNFLVGLRFALTGAWLIMIVAEQINAKSGLGFLMNEARTWFRTDIIVLALVIYGILGLATDAFVRLLQRRLLGWRRGGEGMSAVIARGVGRSFGRPRVSPASTWTSNATSSSPCSGAAVPERAPCCERSAGWTRSTTDRYSSPTPARSCSRNHDCCRGGGSAQRPARPAPQRPLAAGPATLSPRSGWPATRRLAGDIVGR